MTIYFGADHHGFDLKEQLMKAAEGMGYTVVDCGAVSRDENDDYPDFAAPVAMKVGEDPSAGRGVVICGSGIGVTIVVGKFPGIRAALAISPDQIRSGRRDDDVNILALAADFVDGATAEKIMEVFLETPFGGEERYVRRLEKIRSFER